MRIPAFRMMELANTGWALAVLSFDNQPLLNSLSASALPKLAVRKLPDGFENREAIAFGASILAIL